MDAPILVCGLGYVGWRVLEYLQAAGLPVAVIDHQADPSDPRLAGVRLVVGDFGRPEILDRAGVRSARAVLILTSDDLVNVSAALLVRRLNPDVRVVLRMFNQNLLARLGKAVANFTTLSVSALTAPLLALTAKSGEVLAAFPLADGPRQIATVAVADHPALLGTRIGAAATRYGLLVLAHLPAGQPIRQLIEIDADAPLASGDRLIVCASPSDLARLHEGVWDVLFPGLLWANPLIRWGRSLANALTEIDWPVKICTALLIVVLLGSTLTFHLGIGTSLTDGLYRTISLIATGAAMHGEQLVGWQKVFVSSMRLSGMVLTAAFTALFTNYLLRARLGGALEVRHIPDGGHIVVCGLGNLGFRIVEELCRLGERVVAVERRQETPFVVTCRRLGIAVVIGDATVPEVLRQVRAATAKAVVAATPTDLANLEIALLARELNPKQRVVVRSTDPLLAETLRAATDIRLAVSVPELAAPAFLAAIFGDKVLSVFPLGGQLTVVVELMIAAGDPCLDGQSLEAVSVDYELLPLQLVQATPGENARSPRLRPGDRLTAVMPLAMLERLFRREPAPAAWGVELTTVPLMSRETVALWLRTLEGLSAAEAETALTKLPRRVGGWQTRGQARELLGMFTRERATGRLVSREE